MARIRSVKPEFWQDEKLAERTSRDARMLYVGLWNLADEHGRCRGGARYLKGQVFPYDDDLTAKHVDALVDELVAAERVQRYEVGSETYLYLPKLAAHQRLEPSKVPSKHPAPPEPVGADSRPDDSSPELVCAPRKSAQTDPSGSSLLYGSGSLLPVAGSMEHVGGSAPDAETPTPKGRGTRLAPNWQLPADWGRWALTEGLDEPTVRREAAKFADFWHAKSGRDATKLDWAGVWRNWVRRVVESGPRGSPRARPSTTDAAVASGAALIAKYAQEGNP